MKLNNSIIAVVAFVCSSSVLAAPKPQTAPPPPPPLADPVCPVTNPDGSQNSGVDVGDSAYAAVDLQDNGECAISDTSAGACSRVSCYNTSGIFICNNVDNAPAIGCDVVAGMASNIRSACGDTGQTEGVSGYQDISGGAMRVYVTYANCNVDPSAGPFDQ